MAAVTSNSNPRYNVNGKLRDQYYNITGNSGDTLDVGLNTIVKVDIDQPTANTILATSAAIAGLNGGSRITFTTSGAAFTAVNVRITGY